MKAILSWFRKELEKERPGLIVVGVHRAGTTTVVSKMCAKVKTMRPSGAFTDIEYGSHDGMQVRSWNTTELGGHFPPISHSFVDGAQGIIFVMNANVMPWPNGLRPWPIDELHLLYVLDEYIENGKPVLENVPLLVFANKQDLPGALDSATIADGVELSKLPTSEWHVQPCTATSGDSIQEGLEWLKARIQARKYATKSVG